MKTQQNRLHEYLLAHRVIEPLTAWTELGIYRLAAVIFELRKSGLSISTNKIDVLNKFNEKCNVAQYVLEGQP